MEKDDENKLYSTNSTLLDKSMNNKINDAKYLKYKKFVKEITIHFYSWLSTHAPEIQQSSLYKSTKDQHELDKIKGIYRE